MFNTKIMRDETFELIGPEKIPTLKKFHGILYGQSPIMFKVIDQISRVAATSASVLITGESGTGKEMAAQAIKALSPRKEQPFLAVNCGAISPQLIESELFGHEKGSFTGAFRDHLGYFERAHGGTLFLDEITEMPPNLQVKLLRVLETGSFSRLGSMKVQKSDVRIIAATNCDPEAEVRRKNFRKDLLYRIQVFPIHLPPLRERREDLKLIVHYFLEDLGVSEKHPKTISDAALNMLFHYHWPGNFRQLKNILYRAFILAGNRIEASDLPSEITQGITHRADSSIGINIGNSIAEADRKLILSTLDFCNGKREEAAKILGISVKTLYNKLREYK